MAWVHAGNRKPGTLEPTSLGEEQGEVTFEHFEAPTLENIRICKAFEHRDAEALRPQRRRLSFARFAVVLGPVAVLALAVQILFFPHGGKEAIGLIAFELLALAVALAISYLPIGYSHELWIHERLRAEVLRREGFLLLAGIGPYLNIAEDALHEKFEERLLTINNEVNDPVALP